MHKLVDYSDDGSEGTDSASNATGLAENSAKNKLPDLPLSFYDRYQVRPRVGDDPEFHDGRVRGRRHEKGRWPTHVYLEIFVQDPVHSALHNLAELVVQNVPGSRISALSELGLPRPLHISLSPPIMLLTEQRESFMSRVERISQSITEFKLPFTDVSVFMNFHKTREFWIVKCGEHELFNILQDELRKVMTEFEISLAHLYHPHVSLAWRLTDKDLPKSVTDSALAKMRSHAEELKGLDSTFHEIKVKVGSDVYRFPLNPITS